MCSLVKTANYLKHSLGAKEAAERPEIVDLRPFDDELPQMTV